MIYSQAKKYIKEYYTTKTTNELAVHCGIRANVVVMICLELGVCPVKYNNKKPKGPYKPKAQVPVAAADFIVQKSKMERPPAVYNNSPSPFGIADELHKNK